MSGTNYQASSGQSGRVYSAQQIMEYEDRQAKKAERELKEEEELAYAMKHGKFRTTNRPKADGIKVGFGVRAKEVAAAKAGEAGKNGTATTSASQPKETKAEYAARKAKVEANKAAKAEYGAQQKAAYEVREARRVAQQEGAKRRWMTKCLSNNACFNCGMTGHASEACPEPPYEGKY